MKTFFNFFFLQFLTQKLFMVTWESVNFPTYICVNKLYYIKKKKNLKAIKNSIKKRFNFCLTKSNAHREQKNCF